jgi:hypothetical protein
MYDKDSGTLLEEARAIIKAPLDYVSALRLYAIAEALSDPGIGLNPMREFFNLLKVAEEQTNVGAYKKVYRELQAKFEEMSELYLLEEYSRKKKYQPLS